jgi:hypothetical protein
VGKGNRSTLEKQTLILWALLARDNAAGFQNELKPEPDKAGRCRAVERYEYTPEHAAILHQASRGGCQLHRRGYRCSAAAGTAAAFQAFTQGRWAQRWKSVAGDPR